MGDFFKSPSFKILLAVAIILFAFMLRAAWTGGSSVLISEVVGVVAVPFQRVSAKVSGSAVEFFERFINADKIYEENQQLHEQLREMTEKMVDYERYRQENEQFRDFLEIKERNPDFKFEPASVIGRDANSHFYSFTIDKGTLDGVAARNPVITPDGLVGIVSETGLTFSKVITILDVSLPVGAYDVRTRDTGIVTGDIELAQQGLCKLMYLPRESSASSGDIVLTAGIGGIFPKGLVIGTIDQVKGESHGISLYGIIKPAVRVDSIKDVFVIKSFEGQDGGTGTPENEADTDESFQSAQEGGAASLPRKNT